MSSFFEAVRTSTVKHPTQRGFDPQVWRNVAQSDAYDATDQNLALAGLFVFGELDALRKHVEECFPPSSSRESNLRYFVGYENRNFLTIKKDLAHAQETRTEPVHVALSSLQAVPGNVTGEELDADAMLAISIDAAAFIIRNLLRSECAVNHRPDNPSLAAICKTHLLAQLYAAADAAWMERLWSDCTFVPDADGNGCMFRTQESSWGENFCVSELRRHMLKLEFAFRTKQFWEESRRLRLVPPHRHPVIRVQQQGKVLHVRLGPYQRTNTPPMDLIWRMMAQEPYYDHVLDKPVPSDRFPLPSTLAEVRDELAVIADVCSKLIKAVDELLRSVRTGLNKSQLH